MIQRSISMPVKPRYIDDPPRLERSEEKEELFIEEDYSETTKDLQDFELPRENLGDESQDKLHSNVWFWKSTDRKLNSKHGCNRKHIPLLSFRSKKGAVHSARVISKGGKENVTFSKIPQRSLRYCKDFVTTLVEQEWKYTFTMFILSFFASWVIFTALWYLIGYAHGDFIFDEVTGARLGDGNEPCVVGATSLVGIFIYTVETQVTIGFGEKYPSEECPESVFLFVFQIIVSVAIEGAMIGIIYAKMAKPAKPVSNLKFSKQAVIYKRDGKLCFCFRVCDPREQQSIGTKIRIYIIENKKSEEGENVIILKDLKVDQNDSPVIVWPETICHVINESSPLHKYAMSNFTGLENFEIIVTLVGASPTTGQVTESRTSYLPHEILWNQIFPNIIHYDAAKATYLIDYEYFNATVPANANNNP